VDREADRHTNRQTDGQADMTKLIVAFPMFANARNKTIKDLVTAMH
jgi:hypothetical protein